VAVLTGKIGGSLKANSDVIGQTSVASL